MDKHLNVIDNFEEILKQQNNRHPSRLYSGVSSENSHTRRLYNPMDVITVISSQIKAIQNADCVNKKKYLNKKLDKHKSSNFVPVNILKMQEEVSRCL